MIEDVILIQQRMKQAQDRQKMLHRPKKKGVIEIPKKHTNLVMGNLRELRGIFFYKYELK